MFPTFDSSVLWVFVTAVVLLLVTPGPAVLYIVARSLDQGRSAGLVSTLGIAVGTLAHVAAATLGLSAILVSSGQAYDAVRYLGAAYLIYLGVRRLLQHQPAPVAADRPPQTLGRIFRQGVVVNLLNPKTAAFFFAFLPQFVDPARGNPAGQTLWLGILFVALGLASDAVWALLAGSAGRWLRSRPGFVQAQRYVAGTVYLALGVAAALSDQKR